MYKVKYVIIGAGVTGLSFANFVDDSDYILIEKENCAGGYCKTVCVNGFIWDYAGHFFHFTNSDIEDFFISKIPKDDLVYQQKNTKIYYDKKLINYPFQKNIHQLSKSEFIDCLYDLFNKEEKENYSNFKEMLYGKFGESITEKFLKPYNEKLYACKLDKLDVDAMGRFFPYANITQIINNMKDNIDCSYNNEFLYPKMGANVFVDVLLKSIDKSKLYLNSNVVNIDIENKVIETNRDKINYDYLINTMPMKKFLKFLPVNEEVYKEFSCNKVLVFNLGFDKHSTNKKIHWLYFPDKSINFYRVGFYNNILNQERLSMYVEIGYAENDDINVEEQLKLTLENLKKLKIIDDHQLLNSTHVIMNPAYVHISEKVNVIKEKLKNELENKNIHFIGRYGDWKYCSIEDCIVDAKKLANKLK